MKVGLLVTGDTAVRAAHSLAAHSSVDEVVVIGPATSRSFRVVDDAKGCDLLVGTGPGAPRRSLELGVGLVWNGEIPEPGVMVYGASPQGMTLALANRESDPRLVALAHPKLPSADERQARFPKPVGRTGVADTMYAGRPLAAGRSPNEFAACLAIGANRRITIVDDGAFLSGVALAAGVVAAVNWPKAVWEESLGYLEAATEMGLVLAEETSVR